ncbi:MAG TPA: hypothetical protein VM577_06265 [Anaerovoracaceae bacterium]|nr:hypothetical protein [Anaerovoracaceae bacterium]
MITVDTAKHNFIAVFATLSEYYDEQIRKRPLDINMQKAVCSYR